MSVVKYPKRVREFFNKHGDVSSSSYTFDEFLSFLDDYSSTSKAKFDESIDMSIRLGIDPKRTEQFVKTRVVLPNAFGKKSDVLVFTDDGAVAELAKKLGAKYVGMEDMIDKIVGGALVPGKDFQACVATPSVMIPLSKSKAARVLGVAGLMPNAKIGTVAANIEPVLKEIFAGRVELKTDKFGFIKLSIGKLSLKSSAVVENAVAVYKAVKEAKPSSVKGNLFDSIRIGSTVMCASFGIKMSEFYAKD